MAVVGYSLILAFVLLNPSAAVASSGVGFVAELAEWIGMPAPLVEGYRVEFVLNVLAMVPLAVLGSVAWPDLGWRDWTAYGFAISMSIEAVQALAFAGRSATFVDVVANTAGAGAGALAVALWRRAVSARAAA
jgi:glycopeptide antibiotics resistance protein